MHPRLAFVGVEIFTNYSFLGPSFGNRYARKAIKALKTRMVVYSSFQKILSQKIDLSDWRPGPGKVGQKNAKTSLLVTFPPENPKPKAKKIIFPSQLEDLPNPGMV